MRQFIVTAHPKRVQIEEVVKEFVAYDADAIVDGDEWRYKIKKHKNVNGRGGHWRGRAMNAIHYHAHNSGTVVHFEPVFHGERHTRKSHEKRLSLL